MTINRIFPFVTLLCVPALLSCNGGNRTAETNSTNEPPAKKEHIQLIRNNAEKKVDVLIGGELFTSYIYPESLAKPVLYPIKTARGTAVTRGFPLDSRPGERIDHPHHIGLWLNYGDVNGLDFWNNSDAIAEDKKDLYGTIVHQGITDLENGDDSGKLSVVMDWVDAAGNVLLKEETTFLFQGSNNTRIIDRITRLTAQDKAVAFRDNKEGMIGIRMARELEHPSDKAEKFTDANGVPTDVPSLNNEGVTGMYHGSNGLEGEAVWGTRGEWMNLSGQINGENISVAILDHPDNVGYPTYWHSRGYGLFAANPLGQKAMSGGKEELNFQLDSRESVTFKYRVIVYSGEEVKDEQVHSDFKAFAGL
jgi:hypothetical protein